MIKDKDISEIVMVPSFFATTPFPAKRIQSPWLQKQNHRYITTFTSHNPKGEIPFGTYARQLLIHFVTEAELSKNPNIVLNESLARFRKSFSRGEKRTLRGSQVDKALHSQLDRLKYLAVTEERLKAAPSTTRAVIYESAQFADQWIKDNGKDILSLSPTFLLRQGVQGAGGPFPANRATIINLAQSCLALDFYFWSTRKNFSMRGKEEFFAWQTLWEQFTDFFSTQEGHPVSLQRETKNKRAMAYDFKKRLKIAVSKVQENYVLLRADFNKDGLIFVKTKPHIQSSALAQLAKATNR